MFAIIPAQYYSCKTKSILKQSVLKQENNKEIHTRLRFAKILTWLDQTLLICDWTVPKRFDILDISGISMKRRPFVFNLCLICVTRYLKFSCNLPQFAGILWMTLTATRWRKAVPTIQSLNNIVSWHARSAQVQFNLCSVRFSHRKTECNIVLQNLRWLKYTLGY